MEHSFLWLVGEWEIRLGNDSSVSHPYRCCLIVSTTNCMLQKQGWSQLRNEEETAKLIVAWSARDHFFFFGFLGGTYGFGGFCRSSELGHVGHSPSKKAAALASFLEARLLTSSNGHLTITLIFQMQAPFWGGLSCH